MKLENKEQIINAVNDADMVLVGLGKEWERINKWDYDEKYKNIFKKITKDRELSGLIPFLEKNYQNEILPDIYAKAYANLERLLKNKNFYVITLNWDDGLEKSGVQGERLVKPCGNYHFLQCDKGCSEELINSEEESHNIARAIIASGGELDELRKIELPRCKKCGGNMVYNTISAEKYREEGYLEAWGNYTKCLQGTMNKKVCILELGVGMEFPTVIRWPFEKMAFYNQKASFFRIHEKWHQMTEELAEKGYSRQENAVSYFAKLFV